MSRSFEVVFPGVVPLAEMRSDGGELRALPAQSLVLDEECLSRHLMCIGRTGSGKSTRVMGPAIESLLSDKRRSVVIVDRGFALRDQERVLDFAASHGRSQITYLDFLNPKASARWNPIAELASFTEALDFAHALSAANGAAGTGDGQFFEQQAQIVIAGAAFSLSQANRGRHPPLRKLLDLFRGTNLRELRELAEKTIGAEDCSRFADDIANGGVNPRTTQSQIANILQFLYSSEVAETTASNEFTPAAWLRKPGVLYIGIDESRFHLVRGLVNFLVSSLVKSAIQLAVKRGGRLARPLTIVIDEFPAIGQLPRLPECINTLRKRRVSLLVAAQTQGQVLAVYGGKASTLLAGFSNKVLVPPLTLMDADALSVEFGNMTISSEPLATNSSAQIRPVLTAEEIGHPPRDSQLGPLTTWQLVDTPPFQAYMKASYENGARARLRKYRLPNRERRRNDAAHLSPLAPSVVAPQDELAALKKRLSSLAKSNFLAALDETEALALKIRELPWTWFETVNLSEVSEALTQAVGYGDTTDNAKKWWDAFRSENAHRIVFVLRLMGELKVRNANVNEFFLSYVYANTPNIQATLHYLDYTRLKKKDTKNSDEEKNRS